MTVTLNVDLGELPDEPEVLYALASVANVACGGHAGDDASMRRAVALAGANRAAIAAHPSYPDRDNFGRRTIAIDEAALRGSVAAQCRSLRAAGGKTSVVKPHGALYHDANRDPALARALVDGAEIGLETRLAALVAPPVGALADLARDRGIALRREGFADRGYREDGTLVPRTEPNALLTDPDSAVEQALRLATSGAFDTLCLHGDTPSAVALARAVRRALATRGLLA